MTFSPYAKTDQFVRQCKEGGRLTKLLGEQDNFARDIEKSLTSLKAAIVGFHETNHRLQCGYDFPCVPSDESAKKWIASEVARIVCPPDAFLSFVEFPIEKLATPDQIPSLQVSCARAAKAIRAAQEARHKAEREALEKSEKKYAAEQRALREAATQSL